MPKPDVKTHQAAKPGSQGPASKVAKGHRRATYTCSIYDCSFLHKPCYEEVPIAGSVCRDHLEQARAILNHHVEAIQRHREEQSNDEKGPRCKGVCDFCDLLGDCPYVEK